MREGGLHTICEEARCPNIGECWGRGNGDVPDPRRHVHARVPVLLRPLREAGRPAGSARAASTGAGGGADEAVPRRRHVGRPRRPRRPRRRALRRDDPRHQAQAARGEGRDPHARLPRRRGGGARDRPRGAARGLQPQHRDGAATPRPHARRQGELRQGALAARAREGGRRLPGAHEVGDHRRPRGDERRGRRHHARPSRSRRRRRHHRPVPAAVGRSTRRSTAGCTPTSSAGSASRARRSGSARCSPGPLVRSSYRADEQRHAAETGRGAVAY